MPRSKPAVPATSSVEDRIQQLGRTLWEQLERRKPSVFERRWWLDQVLEWAMRDESVKVQMFRFVDVLPTLRTSQAVAQHLQEYFEDVESHLPTAVKMGLSIAQPDSLLGKALAVNARMNARKMAERFIAGATPAQIYASVLKLRKQGLAFTLDLLGEAVVSETEAVAYQQAYLQLLADLAPQVNQWPDDPVLDRRSDGFLPRCQVSLKLSALTGRFRPIDPRATAKRVKAQLRPILQQARDLDAQVHVDMEHYAYKDLTLRIFEEMGAEADFRDWPHFGIVIQAYLPDAGEDLERLLRYTEQRGAPITVRLVKGAYWDYETITAESRGWPCPVYQQKWESDANFERQTRFLMEHAEALRPAIASHNLRSLAAAMAWAEELSVPALDWEIQMLYGMAEDMQRLISERGQRVRIYAPFGEMLPGMSYLVRRLLENTSNESFLRQAYAADAEIASLLAAPAPKE